MSGVPRVLAVLFFLGAGVYFLQGFCRSLALDDESTAIPFQIGHGVGVVSVGMMVVLLWGSWRSKPPQGGGL